MKNIRFVFIFFIFFTTNILFADSENKKLIALTFDDGPSRYTSQIVSILKEYDIPATFFVVGTMVRDKPKTFQNVISYNKIQIENHTFSHKNLELLSDDDIHQELLECNDIIKKYYKNDIKFFRPPYLSTNIRIESVAKKLGLLPVFGIGGNDTKINTTSKKIVSEILSMLKNKSQIIILHDAGKNIEITIEALPILIEDLKERGYVFVSLDDFYKS